MKQRVILSTTMVFPTRTHPLRGEFVQRRLAAMQAIWPVVVVSPQPWFPILRPTLDTTEVQVTESPPVVRPRMFYVPGVMKGLDAGFYANSLRAGLHKVEREHQVLGIDAHFEWPDAVGAWMVARERGLPFVCTLRGKLVSQSRNRHKRRLMTQMIADAESVIAVSQSLAELAQRLVGRAIDIRVIPNGVDSGIFHRTTPSVEALGEIDPTARESLGWNADVRYAVSVGHAQKLKGFHRLVEIWPEVCRRAGDVRLVLVGGEANEPGYGRQLRQLIQAVNRKIGGPSRQRPIEWVGAVSQKRIATMLNAADLFALASSSEGWCNAIGESLACGCPVVATDVGGNAEVLGGAQHGLLTPFGDSTSMTDAIVRALHRDWNRAAIAEFGSARTWEAAGRESVAVFEEACEKHASRARRSA